MEAAAREGIRWYPRVTILKYSAEQMTWARRRYGDVPLDGWDLEGLLHVPEDGIVCDAGNGLTGYGLVNLAAVLTGEGGHPLAPGRAVFGVGSDETAFDREQVHLSRALGEEPGRSWYRPMDPGYPRVAGGAVIEGQVTFAETEACFEWKEWCWGTGPAEPVPHHSLRGCYGGEQPVMMNRKASPQGYGLKEPGVAWVFKTHVDLLG